MNATRVLAGFLSAAMAVGMVQPVMANEEVLPEEGIAQEEVDMQVDEMTENADDFDEAAVPAETEMALTEAPAMTTDEAMYAEEDLQILEEGHDSEYVEITEEIEDTEDTEELMPEEELIDISGEEQQNRVVSLMKCENGEIRILNLDSFSEIGLADREACTEYSGFQAGDEIHFAVTPAEGYSIASLRVCSLSDQHAVYELTETDEGYMFLMPEDNVEIRAEFVLSEETVNMTEEEVPVQEEEAPVMTEEEVPVQKEEAPAMEEIPDREEDTSGEAEETGKNETGDTEDSESTEPEESAKKKDAEVNAKAAEAESDELLFKASSTDEFTVGDYTYKHVTGGLSVTKYSGKSSYLTIPSSQRGYAVVEIGLRAFEDNKNIKGVTIPSSIRKIGMYAFRGTGLRSVTIPKTISNIGYDVFANCTDLTTVTFQDGMREIPSLALCDALSVHTVKIPKSITSIGTSAFQGTSIRSFDMTVLCPNVRKMGGHSFSGCRGLSNVKLPSGLEYMGTDEFKYTAVTSIVIPKSVRSMSLAVGSEDSITNVTFQSGMKEIPNLAMYYKESLDLLYIPRSVTSIGEGAFRNLKNANVVYEGSKEELAKIAIGNNNDGLLKLIKANKVKCLGKQNAAKKISVTSVKMNSTKLTLTKGKKATLKATVSPSNATNKKVTWKSSNTAVASVTQSGKVTAKRAGTAKITVTTADGKKTASCTVTVKNPAKKTAAKTTPSVSYRTHVQTYGWQGWKKNGAMSGTSGQSKRLEGIIIKLSNLPYSGGIMYRTHVQTYGWQGWKKNGQMSGTSGQAKRLEGIQIRLTGEMAKHYDVYYRVHAQTYGWLGWAKNGTMAGTSGLAKRLEGINIVLVPKGGKAPGSTARPNVVG